MCCVVCVQPTVQTTNEYIIIWVPGTLAVKGLVAPLEGTHMDHRTSISHRSCRVDACLVLPPRVFARSSTCG